MNQFKSKICFIPALLQRSGSRSAGVNQVLGLVTPVRRYHLLQRMPAMSRTKAPRQAVSTLHAQKCHFSTKPEAQAASNGGESGEMESPAMTLEEIRDKIDMEQLRKFNPKLHAQVEQNPEVLLDLQQVVQEHELHAEAAALQESMTAVAEAASNASIKQPKVYSLPFIWAYGAPVFNATAAALISIQAGTSIPWFPFIIMCGFGVRLILAPMMVRQMILINKMSHASPSIRLTAKLIKHAKMPLYKRVFHGGRAMYDYSKQTKTNLLAFYFYNIIQIPVFIVMVLSIRKISTENEDLSDSGYLWFKNLNEPDAYLILPLLATALNYFNLGRGITKDNEHWFVNRFRSFFQVLQFFHLPFTHQWPAGAFVYWISSSLFVAMQQTVTRKPWFLNKVNPNYFYDFQKMYSERSPSDHENYVDRMLNVEDPRLKQFTNTKYVQEELESEMKRFLAFQRMKQVRDKATAMREQTK